MDLDETALICSLSPNIIFSLSHSVSVHFGKTFFRRNVSIMVGYEHCARRLPGWTDLGAKHLLHQAFPLIFALEFCSVSPQPLELCVKSLVILWYWELQILCAFCSYVYSFHNLSVYIFLSCWGRYSSLLKIDDILAGSMAGAYFSREEAVQQQITCIRWSWSFFRFFINLTFRDDVLYWLIEPNGN